MTIPDPSTWAPKIRGQERQELVDDLARGDENMEALAAKFSRSIQAVRQFSARNAAEIQGRRQVLQGELATETSQIWIADKATRIAWRAKLAEDLDSRLDDEDLEPRLRSRYTRDIDMLLHKVAEELGDLRTRLDVAVQKNVLTDFTEFVIDDDGTFHPLAGSGVDGPARSVDGPDSQ